MQLKLFVCGPTVYDRIHIGNARTFVVFDAYAKWLRYSGVDLSYIMNITDIEDKIIARAREYGQDALAYSRELENKFYEDVKAVGVTSPEYKRATDHIPEVISQVERLIAKGYGYEIPNSGIYFDLAKFPDYGKLSGRTKLEDNDAVSRIDENEKKRNKGDFCIWKVSKSDEPSWDSPWGKGRPGWHIEDTAITEKYFGPQYDVHGGGADLKFPHHEAEIALMESISGLSPFVKKWMHVGFLVNKNAKMSKSAGNFTTLHDLLQTYSPEAIRFFLLSAHYRSPLDYSEKSLNDSEAATQRFSEFLRKIDTFEDEMPSDENSIISSIVKNAELEFSKALESDFNTPRAYAVIFDLMKEINPMIANRALDQQNAARINKFFEFISEILGIVSRSAHDVPQLVIDLMERRERARRDKNFDKSDELREQIKSEGYAIDDTAYGPLIKIIQK